MSRSPVIPPVATERTARYARDGVGRQSTIPTVVAVFAVWSASTDSQQAKYEGWRGFSPSDERSLVGSIICASALYK